MSVPTSTPAVGGAPALTPGAGSAQGVGEPAELLVVESLSIVFPGHPPAVRGLGLRLHAGEMHGLVGESGSGKTQTLLAILGLSDPRAAVGGRIRFRGQDLLGRPEAEVRRVRGRHIGLVFQDPLASLNPSYTIGWAVEESLRLQRPGMTSRDRRARVLQVLDEVGLPGPSHVAGQFPHELSGGMRQRALLALVLASDPEILLADEPTTALDVTLAAEVLDLLDELRARRDLGIVFVSHDLNLVASRCDRVSVMYAGVVVETAPAADIFRAPLHPYSRALLAASVDPFGPPVDAAVTLQGDPIDAASASGCPFAARCAFAVERCRVTEPVLVAVDAARASACVRQAELAWS